MLPDGFDDIESAHALEAHDPAVIVTARRDRGQVILEIAPEKIREACRFLKDERRFLRLSGITAVDWHPAEPRFEVVYQLHSIESNERLRLKCRLPGDSPGIESVTGVWRNADWYEREVFDLFGVTFRGHPNLKRLMMPEDWEGHPLRKDFPVHGHKYGYQDE
jgi:NADH-quinone oxidoreductase subunit C